MAEIARAFASAVTNYTPNSPVERKLWRANLIAMAHHLLVLAESLE